MSQTRPNVIEITWTLSMDQANMVLSIIAKQPFEAVADLIVELRNQAQAQIQLFQQQQTGANQMNTGSRIDGEARVQ